MLLAAYLFAYEQCILKTRTRAVYFDEIAHIKDCRVFESFLSKFVIRLCKPMIKRIFVGAFGLVVLMSITGLSVEGQKPEAEGQVHWMTFEQAMEKSRT